MSRQHGLVTTAQARACGLTARQIQLRVETGEWERIHPGVFRHSAHPPTWEGRLLAATLALGPGVAASHRSALGLWGLHGYKALVVEVSVPRESGIIGSRGVLKHRARDLRPEHVCARNGVPVTRPARTLIDLGAVAPPSLVARCMEEWLADRIVSVDELRAAVEEHRGKGRRGVGVLRRALETRVLVDLRADSGVEALLARVLKRHRVALPELHHVVKAGPVVAELDYAYPHARIALEVDGYGVHLRSREAFEHDRHRQNELEIAGWRVLRFTSRALRREPDRVAAQVERMLSAG